MKIIFDLDGTLADASHRMHHISGPVKDWDAFYAACVDDKPIMPIIDTLHTYLFAGDDDIEIWTGRSEIVRAETLRWLDNNLYPFGRWQLRMRGAKDRRPDWQVKEGWLMSLPVDEWPSLVFEDRSQVVAMWRRQGIMCCQVNEGNF